MGRVIELTVAKGRAVEAGDGWLKVEYGIKATIDHNEEVAVARERMEALLDEWLGLSPKPASASGPPEIFPEDLRALLSFEETAGGWKITPRAYLGPEIFRKAMGIVRQHGGQYVSAGKDSHFRIPSITTK
jgi:hypothetical protein